MPTKTGESDAGEHDVGVEKNQTVRQWPDFQCERSVRADSDDSGTGGKVRIQIRDKKQIILQRISGFSFRIAAF